MKKQNKSKRKNQAVRQYFIPMTKNQFQRQNFEQTVCEWVNGKFDFVKIFIEGQKRQEHDSELVFREKCKQVQNQFTLKHKIDGLISFFPLDYYQTLIRYAMEKKLYWTFKIQQSSQIKSQTIHSNMQVQLALALKKYYKNYQYNHKNLHNGIPQNNQNTSPHQQSFNSNKTTLKTSLKRPNPDFLYDLLLMFSVCVVAAFFQYFFPQLQIDKVFRSQIYIIINHGFLDLEVSPSVYEIIEKKHRMNKHKTNFQSLNASYIRQFSNSVHKNCEKNPNNPDSKRTIGDQKIKSTATIGNQTLNKFPRFQNKQNEVKNVHSIALNHLYQNTLLTLNQFQNKSLKKPKFNKESFIKQTTSIGGCLPSDRNHNGNKKNFKSHPNMNVSRFNSFLKDAKPILIPNLLEEALDNGYLPTNEEIDFYTTIKNCLHVDALPPIKKKKMNIYQYQKLNQVDKIKQIKKQIKNIDQTSKKHHIMSNDISLAMNTFISTSFEFPKRKKIQTGSLNFTESKVHNHQKAKQNKSSRKNYDLKPYQTKSVVKSFTVSENKQNFQLKKLPLKASTLKFQLTKSCNFYSFDDKVLKIAQDASKQVEQIKSGTIIPPPTIHKLNEWQKCQNKEKFQQRNKKSSTQVVEQNPIQKYNKLKNETICRRQSEKKANNKRQIQKRKYSRDRLSELQSIGSNSDIKSIASFKYIQSRNIIEGLKKRVSRNMVEENEKAIQRESILNNFQLSSKMQKYELGTKQVTQIQLINQNTNRTEDSFRYGPLDGQVNVQKDVLTNYKTMYKSFDLKKKLRDFEATCKHREEISNFSMFNVHTMKERMINGVNTVKEQDDEESKGRPSECTA